MKVGLPGLSPMLLGTLPLHPCLSGTAVVLLGLAVNELGGRPAGFANGA